MHINVVAYSVYLLVNTASGMDLGMKKPDYDERFKNLFQEPAEKEEPVRLCSVRYNSDEPFCPHDGCIE